MKRSLLLRAFAVLLAVFLLAPPVFAAGGRVPNRRPGLLAAVLQLLGPLVPPLLKGRGTLDPNGATAAAGTEGRGTLDPDGATAGGTPPDDTEGRSTIDPNG